MKLYTQVAVAALALAGGSALMVLPASAQYHPPFSTPGFINNGSLGHQVGVGRRIKDAEDKINDGVRDNQLSPQEASGLQQRLNYVRTQMQMYKAEHNGHMSGEETRKLEAVMDHIEGALIHERSTSHQ